MTSPPDQAPLKGLADRLSKAEGGSRELDGDIYWALQRARAQTAYWNATLGPPRILPSDFIPKGMGRLGVISAAPHFTTSLDAAVALVEAQLGPASGYRVSKLTASERWPGDGPYWATCGLPGAQEGAHANSAPIALVLALLKALEAQHDPS